MIFINSKSNDPYYNMALEEYAFNKFDYSFILWQNENTIVVGKFQNTIEEINSDYVKQNNIKIVRRLSGGGAMYQDLGNVNFTFVSKKEDVEVFNFEHFTENIILFLNEEGVKAEFNSRNDLVVNGKKFSGNSQYVKDGKILHHGTLLFNSNLEVLINALNVSNIKIESKAIKSIRERVANLIDCFPKKISLDCFKNSLVEFISKKSPLEIYNLTELDDIEILKLRNEKYSTWEWNYGESPGCNVEKEGKFNGGNLKIYMDIKAGKINKIKFYGDFFASKNIEDLEKMFIGKKLIKEEIEEASKDSSIYINDMDSDWLSNFILNINM